MQRNSGPTAVSHPNFPPYTRVKPHVLPTLKPLRVVLLLLLTLIACGCASTPTPPPTTTAQEPIVLDPFWAHLAKLPSDDARWQILRAAYMTEIDNLGADERPRFLLHFDTYVQDTSCQELTQPGVAVQIITAFPGIVHYLDLDERILYRLLQAYSHRSQGMFWPIDSEDAQKVLFFLTGEQFPKRTQGLHWLLARPHLRWDRSIGRFIDPHPLPPCDVPDSYDYFKNAPISAFWARLHDFASDEQRYEAFVEHTDQTADLPTDPFPRECVLQMEACSALGWETIEILRTFPGITHFLDKETMELRDPLEYLSRDLLKRSQDRPESSDLFSISSERMILLLTGHEMLTLEDYEDWRENHPHLIWDPEQGRFIDDPNPDPKHSN